MYNKVILIGRMVADPEVRTTAKGTNVANFRIAVDRPLNKDKERKADFITVTAWGQLGEFASNYFGKGKLIGIEGQIMTNDYTDREGNKRYTFEVKADRLFFVGPKEKSSAEQCTAATDEYTVLGEYEDEPF